MNRTLGEVVDMSHMGTALAKQATPSSALALEKLRARHLDERNLLKKQCAAELYMLNESRGQCIDDDPADMHMIKIDFVRLRYVSCLRWLQLVCRHQQELAEADLYMTHAKIYTGDACTHYAAQERKLRPEAIAFGLPVEEYYAHYLS